VPEVKAVIVGYELITGFGLGIKPLWKGLLAKNTSVRRIERFSTKSFQSRNAAFVLGLTYLKNKSLASQMLSKVFAKNSLAIPQDAFLILATTVGEIDILEKSVLEGKGVVRKSALRNLLKKAQRLAKIRSLGMVISCACASSLAAIAQGSAMIRRRERSAVLVVAVDSVSEFVFSGFSSLMALDKDKPKPFDRNRSGLALGEAAGFVLLMSEERARHEKRRILGEVSGWGLSCDANHMTGPSRDGSGLAKALREAFNSSGLSSSDIGCICAHGTGTLYNDSMEIEAFKKVYKKPISVYSIKGAVGHTLGAAGLIETIVALKAQEEGSIPATVGLKNIDPEAKGWVSASPQKLKKKTVILNNCGFGGINAALVLKSHG